MSDGFFSRWSRLKRGEAPAAATSPPSSLPEPGQAPEPVAEVRLTDGEPEPHPVSPAAESPAEFDITTLPDVETATADTDFTGFLQKGVPESLKHRALRQAWSLDPSIRDFIGPADYAWDFNAEGGAPGFSLTLGGDVTRLLAQAIGQVERVAEALTEAPSFLPPGTVVAQPTEAVEAPPEDPLRLAAPEELPAAPPEAEPLWEADALPLRRHGGATPV